MKVIIVNGYGNEKETEVQQEKFLNYFKSLLLHHGLSISSIVSERTTGGEITLDIPDDVDPDEITRSFLSLATTLSQEASLKEGEEIHVSFDLVFPALGSVPITVLGTGY